MTIEKIGLPRSAGTIPTMTTPMEEMVRCRMMAYG
jgi:hypothetical protein